MTEIRRRNPSLWLTLIVVVTLLGLGSRHFANRLPWLVAAFAGDTLWATVAFLGIGLVIPRVSTWRVAALALAFSIAIELSQLYHAPWIDSIRRTTVGGLILGNGFVLSDLACYAVGVGLGILIEWFGLRDRQEPETRVNESSVCESMG
jgi:hypothetical protein